jgi:hypothetical protein
MSKVGRPTAHTMGRIGWPLEVVRVLAAVNFLLVLLNKVSYIRKALICPTAQNYYQSDLNTRPRLTNMPIVPSSVSIWCLFFYGFNCKMALF